MSFVYFNAENLNKVSGSLDVRYDFFLLLGIVLIAPNVSGQDLASIGQQPALKINGGLSLSQIVYGASDRQSRRDPYSYFFTGNLNLSLFGWSAPFSFSLSNQNRSFQQPFNQFGLHPTYKWITGHLGYSNMSFSPYTLAGHVFRGVGVEATPGKFLLSAMYGQLQKAVQADSSRNIAGAFERNGFGFKTGYRDGNNYAELSLFHGKDDPQSIIILPDDDSLLPEENLALGVSLGKTLFQKFNLQFEYGSSALTRDIREGSSEAVNPISTLGLLSSRPSTSYYDAFKAGANYAGNNYSIGVGVERIDPGYRTHGAYYFNNDFVNYTINGTTTLLDSKLNISANAGVQTDNLDRTKISSMKRFVGAINTSFTPVEKLSLTASYSNFQSFTNVRSQFVDINQLTQYDNLDTLQFTQITQSINFGANYNLKSNEQQRQILFANFSLQDAAEQQSQTEQNNGSQFYNLSTSYSLSLIPSNLTFSVSYALNQNRTPSLTLSTHGPTVSVGKALMERKLRLALSSSYNTTVVGKWRQSAVSNVRSNVNYVANKKHNFGLSAVVVNRNSATELGPVEFAEYTGTIVYSYAF